MTNITTPLIKASDVAKSLKNKNTIVIDARIGPDAETRYKAGHPEGALHVDLDRDLSQKPVNAAMGGRHPLPEVKNFSALLGKLGITPAAHVIVYDDKNGANAAARFWWMMRAAGHDLVQVVDGGLDAIMKENIPLTSEAPEIKQAAPYPFTQWKLPTVNIDAVAAAAKDPDALVIDVRESFRYRGEREPIDLTAGHIPGAINIPYVDNLKTDGTFADAEKLASNYKKAIGNRKPENVIVHCGSGVTACHTLLALEQAGIKGAQLYVGSWSEWSRNDRPIATGE
jgi:thiosulfate/3-mercaptopyruvate sulfurtransferase